MNLFGIGVPIWVLDWTGSALVVMSLVYLFGKRIAYWHFSNASLLPYFALFVTGKEHMLAGLQASYLIFGVHGLLLWRLERRRDVDGVGFPEKGWYHAGWILSLAIFGWTITLTDFVDAWTWLQFTIVSCSLLANWATTRTWTWSWPVWLLVNTMQALYFWRLEMWALFGLQFVLFAMSIHGWQVWRAERSEQSEEPVEVARVRV